jgi:hypothetical protein
MLSADLRRIARTRRQLSRAPLRQLLEHAAYHAIEPLENLEFTDLTVRRAHEFIQAAFEKLADAGALVFFGLRDAAELGYLPVTLVQVDEHGSLRVDVREAVEVVIAGAARREGWKSPKHMTIEDLAR